MSILLIEPYSKFTFHCGISQIWSLIKTTTQFAHLISTINNQILTEPILISKEQTYEIESQFRFSYKEMLKIYFTVEKMVETDYYCTIQWRMSLINSDKLNLNAITISIHLHHLSSSSTIFICQIQGDLLRNMNQVAVKAAQPQAVSQPQRELNQIYQRIERFLTNKNIVHLNCESRIISTTFRASFAYFSSIKICTGLIGKIVSMTHDDIRKGNIVVTLVKPNESAREEELILQVQKCRITKDSFKTRFYVYQKNRSTPIRAMTTELYKVNNNETLAVLTHHFYYAIDEDHFNQYSVFKRKFLKKLSHIIDVINKDNPRKD